MLYQCCAGFYPVTIIHVSDAIDVADLCMVDVATYYAIKSTLPAVVSKVLLKLENKIHCFFHTMFEIQA
jgi:hypothetical protein